MTSPAARALMFAVALGGFVGCAIPGMGRMAPAAMTGMAMPSAGRTLDTTEAGPPIVEVREFPHSAIVSIVAWSPDEAEYGLHARLERGDGSLIRDHRLYVSTYFMGRGTAVDPRVYVRPVTLGKPARVHSVVETVTPPKQVLDVIGILRDDRACYYDKHTCTPFETFEVRIPDALLRENRDSVGVRLYGRGGMEMVVTIRRELIDPYLAKVDSVSAALRSNNN